ncbi:MAG: hypothetical protein JWO89_2406 [Verrucomicrobiaceae bacterium]|nr:hypothetical protein [Verrucomicrobiaceae bacterium]
MVSNRRRYLNFTTPVGVNLAAVAQSGFSSFLIHETGFRENLSGWNHEGVDSPFWRFYHNPTPGCFIHCNGREIPLNRDSVVLIPADAVFDCCGPVAAAHFWIHFTVTRPGRADIVEPVVLAVDEVFRLLLDEALQLHGGETSDLRDQRLYHTSAALLHVAFSRMDVKPAEPLPEPLTALLAAIHNAPNGDFSNTLLARRMGMGVEKFIRWFREQTGHTPAAYVAAARVRLAKEALALTDKTIDHIASAHGFPNRHYFSRVFMKQVGCGPAEFRARQRVRKGL